MAPRGKVGTKGKKQIHKENAATLNFYIIIIVLATVIYGAIHLFVLNDSSTFWTWLGLLFAMAVYAASYFYMRSMAKPTFAQDGGLQFGGTDLNTEEGAVVHLKDVILLTAIVQISSTISGWFWLLWALVPGRAAYLLWWWWRTLY